MAENEYKEKEEPVIEDKSGKTAKKETRTKKSQSTSGKTSADFLSIFKLNVDEKKLNTTLGSTLLLLSIFLFLASFSYIFTWKEDQDQILNKGFFEYIFSSDDVPAENWLGKFGAWFSHLLIYKWFGLASFGIPFLLFLSAVKRLFNTTLLPIKPTYLRTISIMVWASMFLGFFADKVNYLGGSFGYYINDWLSITLGSFGAIITILVMGYVGMVLLFNPNFGALFDRFSGKNIEPEEEPEENLFKEDPYNDFSVVNTLKEDEIKQDEVAETIDFDEAEDDFESELEVTYKETDDDFEVEIPDQEEPSTTTIDDDFSVDIAEADESLDESELNSLREEYGDYDPTLDLSSYKLPPIELLKEYGSGGVSVDKQELEDNKNRIVETLSHYKIDIAKIKATVGPTVTLYEIVPAPGVRISKIKNLEDDIALSLSALGIRIIAPIPGKGTIGIEVPNSKPEMVSMRSLIASEKFQTSDAELPIVMGKTITNETFTFDLTKMPHLLVAGATGQGKSVGLNAILISILYKKHPAQVKFVLVDPKKVELTLYNKIERHYLAKLPGEADAIITDVTKVVNTLNSLCIEMDERYELLKDAGVRTIIEYNAKFIARKLNPEKGHRYLPYIVVLIDEFADLIMTAGKEVEHPIARLAQLARAIGIHLIVATQRPSVNVITGMIKANFPARIGFRVLSKIDSRTILDSSGADQLIGRGDMLISTGSDLKRLQCGFVDTPEVEAICSYIGDQRGYPEAFLLPEYVGESGEGNGDIDMDEIDSMFAEAARIVVINQQGSASLLQRKLKLGYNRAGRIVDQLEGMGIIGSFQGSKAREVLFSDIESLDEFLKTKGII
ncbi:MAG: DNA translocase FtsK [Bacteroidetes bacterium]|nr:MAG: DNA translocase FtsK [Bacteroidota bacterium]